MFPHQYFAAQYFAPQYFPPVLPAETTTTGPAGAGRAKRFYYRVKVGKRYHNVLAENLDEFLKDHLRKEVAKPVKRDTVQARRVKQTPVDAPTIQAMPVYRQIARDNNSAEIIRALAWAAYELAIEQDDEEIIQLLIH